MTRKTYCGNLLWQSGPTLMVPSNRGAKRLLNIQKVSFDETGFPVMGKAIGAAAQRQPPGE